MWMNFIIAFSTVMLSATDGDMLLFPVQQLSSDEYIRWRPMTGSGDN